MELVDVPFKKFVVIFSMVSLYLNRGHAGVTRLWCFR